MSTRKRSLVNTNRNRAEVGARRLWHSLPATYRQGAVCYKALFATRISGNLILKSFLTTDIMPEPLCQYRLDAQLHKHEEKLESMAHSSRQWCFLKDFLEVHSCQLAKLHGGLRALQLECFLGQNYQESWLPRNQGWKLLVDHLYPKIAWVMVWVLLCPHCHHRR